MATIADPNLLDPATFMKGPPHDYFDALRRDDPCHEIANPLGGSIWALTRAADIRSVSMDTARFTSTQGFMYPSAMISTIRAAGQDTDAFRSVIANNLMWQNGPRHDRLRGFLASAFSPRVVGQFDHWIREICVRIVREINEKKRFDAIPQIAAELPAQVIASILGVPEADRHRILDWAILMFGRMDPEIGFEGGARARQEVIDYVAWLRGYKRENPGADMATELMNASHDDVPITDAEYNEAGLSLLIAGFETTHTLIAQSLLLMATDDDARAQIEGNPLKLVLEELLRYTSPVMHMGRSATEDVELHGKTIRKDDFVMLWYTASNRDPDVYDEPHRFNVNRARKGHAAFGAGGPHYCIGSHLAKLEAEILLEEFRKANVRLELDGDWTHAVSVSINAIARMPMKIG